MTLVAGSVAMEFSSSETPTASSSSAVGLDTVQPRSGWAFDDRKDQESEAREHEFGESYHLPLEWTLKRCEDENLQLLPAVACQGISQNFVQAGVNWKVCCFSIAWS